MSVPNRVKVWILAVLTVVLGAWPGAGNDPRDGEGILSEMVEANRYWLLSPPGAVVRYAYTFHRYNADPLECAVPDGGSARGARRQGITYDSLIHHLARHPDRVEITTVEESEGLLRLTLQCEAFTGGCGNGIEGSWYGYFNLGGETGVLVLDAETMNPVTTVIGDVEERFSDYVEVAPGHHVPLSIRLQNGDGMRFDWTFRVHRPGLWLLDRSLYGGKSVAWVDGVTVNQQPAELIHQTETAAKQAREAQVGGERVREFLAVNRHWLLPSLDQRKGLVYDYRQEEPYHERVIFDFDGNVMVQLESTKDHPNRATRQRLWSFDGQVLRANVADLYVHATDLDPSPAGLLQDRLVQHLAMGLGLDCALTRLARAPEACWVNVLPTEPSASHYTMVLHWHKDARLFVGTMLAFTSWAYMHDIRYQRSEIQVDAHTHRPLRELNFSGDELVGQVVFADYLVGDEGAAPGTITAMIPNEKDGQDQRLEMTAAFQLLPRGQWLLRHVDSAFRGGDGGSTGTVTIPEVRPELLRLPDLLLERARATGATLAQVEEAPEGTRRLTPFAIGADVPFSLRPTWSDEARNAGNGRRDEAAGQPALIGIHQVGSVRDPDGGLRVTLDGIARCEWKAYWTSWTARVTTAFGETVTATAETEVRSEANPNAFTVELVLPGLAVTPSPRELVIEGRVHAMSGMYHGHGMWMTFQR